MSIGAATIVPKAHQLNKIGEFFHHEQEQSAEKKLTSSTAILDFFNVDEIKKEYLANNFPPGFSEEIALQEMGITDVSTKEGLIQAVPHNENQANLLILLILKLHYQNHGTKVAAMMNAAEQFFASAPKINPVESSIGTAVEIGKPGKDSLNNPVLNFIVNSESINALISDTSESLINMSFETGYGAFTYKMYGQPDAHWPMIQKGVVMRDSQGNILSEGPATYKDHLGNQISEGEYHSLLNKAEGSQPVLLAPKDRDIDRVDGYFGEHTAENVVMLVKIAHKHPEKILIAAGGNPTGLNEMPDITEIRAVLENKGLWPKNLIVAGYQITSDFYTGPASYGADIYVSDQDLKKLGFEGASSFATPVVSEVIRQLIANGLTTQQEVLTTLAQITVPKKAWRGGTEEIEYNLLNLDLAKEKLTHLTQTQ